MKNNSKFLGASVALFQFDDLIDKGWLPSIMLIPDPQSEEQIWSVRLTHRSALETGLLYAQNEQGEPVPVYHCNTNHRYAISVSGSDLLVVAAQALTEVYQLIESKST